VALSIYSTGITIGSLCAAIYVGLYIGMFDWRTVFITVGLAGVPIGLLMLLTVKEPPRGYTDPPGATRPEAPPLWETVGLLARNRTFRQVTIGATLASFVGYAISGFIVLFLAGSHGLGVQQAALTILAPLALTGAVGTWLCGYLGSRIGGDSILWLPAVGLVLATVFHLLAFNAGEVSWLLAFLSLGTLFQYFYIGPMYSVAGGVVEAHTRATAIAILLFVVNLIGLGLGPLFAGVVSDALTGHFLAEVGTLTLEACKKPDTLSPADAAQCATAGAEGLRYALMITVLIFAWGALHFLLAIRSFRADRRAK
jgi:MFS family permease